MKRGVINLLLLFSLPVFCNSQEAIYQFQRDDSLLKKQWFELSSSKKDALLKKLDKKDAADYKEIYEERLKEVGSLLKTSRAVTEPIAHQYLQSLVKKIIDANPELKGTDARIFFTRDWWPNAYSMGDGNIAFNAGLMVFLKNEAELVFVLCHELSHYQLDHSGKAINKYITQMNSKEFQSELKKLSKQQYGRRRQLETLAKSLAFDNRRHKRENEAEADRQAFTYMKNTGYDVNGIQSCLQLLNEVDDSTVYPPLDLQRILSFDSYPFKKKWILKESSIFSQLGADDGELTKAELDSLKTHPDCITRIELLKDSIQSVAKGKEFLVNEPLFNKLKHEFFLEIIEQNYRQGNLSRNLYYSLQLLQANENLPLAIYSVSRSLNDIYESQKNHKLGSRIDKEHREMREDYNLLLRMLSRIRLEEIKEINEHFCRKYLSIMKDNEAFMKEMKRTRLFASAN